jgi:hypothetical protein
VAGGGTNEFEALSQTRKSGLGSHAFPLSNRQWRFRVYCVGNIFRRTVAYQAAAI